MSTTEAHGWGSTTTTDEVLAGVDLTGHTAIVTGASSGIGAETARALASVGATVVLAVRDLDAGALVADTILEQHPSARAQVSAMDLTDLRSVRRFADEMLGEFGGIALLINNAGVMGTPFLRTADGFEMQFGTNHLGHFLLTNLLWPLLRSPGTRVVNLSSGGHGLSDVVWDDPNYHDHPYDKWEAYGQSKTANILFTLELERRLASTGGHAYAVHPGMVGTNLGRSFEPGDFKALMSRSPRTDGPKPTPVPMKSIPAGAATTIWAATDPGLAAHGGTYLEDCGIGVPKEYALDAAAAARLWAMSEALVDQAFPAPDLA
ncbi:MAG: putative oxidoreductase [Ilumatobacteraceae bacterium]|nr:putative oxidoreductase [Ilumatobacteraceae bacterium]